MLCYLFEQRMEQACPSGEYPAGFNLLTYITAGLGIPENILSARRCSCIISGTVFTIIGYLLFVSIFFRTIQLSSQENKEIF